MKHGNTYLIVYNICHPCIYALHNTLQIHPVIQSFMLHKPATLYPDLSIKKKSNIINPKIDKPFKTFLNIK